MFTNQNKVNIHNHFMELALKQAEINLGNTNSNPSVGCIITKDNNVISAGHTSMNGRPHAEYNAIKSSKNSLKNSNLYVTLEPCSHFGVTPPCVDTIIKKKIKKVFFSIKDPDLRSYNKSHAILKKSGIQTKFGFLNSNIKKFYRSYFKYKKNSLPFVTCKLAISKDFFTINKNKENIITNESSRSRVHLMRSKHDCIITSSGTILKDNPRLTCRIKGLENRSPSRILLDRKLKISMKSKIFKDAKKYQTIVFYNSINKKKIKKLKKMNVKLFRLPVNERNLLNLKECLKIAKKLGFNRIFIEAGLELTYSFLKNKLVDDFKLCISKKKLGNKGRASFKKYYNVFLKKKNFYNEKVNLFNDKLLSFNLK